MEALLPPENVRGMKSLNKELFKREVTVRGVVVPKRRCQEVVKALRKNSQCLKVTAIAPVREVAESKDSMLVLLVPEVEEEQFPTCMADLLTSGDASLSQTTVTLEFDNFSTTQILESILPEDVPIISGFATIGHIAHMNLRREQEPYKHVIGEVILEKNRTIRTVVNKTHSIDNTFRTFNMELLAGEDCTMVTHSENGCTFKFNFAKVFWNSRLCSEHLRVVDMLSKTAVVCDVFAGVGPFVIPAAKRGCRVYANDLNSSSTDSLTENCQLNHVSGRVSVFTLDGRQFLKDIAAKVIDYRAQRNGGEAHQAAWPMFDHVVMNLPAIAITFLDAFRGLFAGHDAIPLPMVHCYCFSSAENPEVEIVSRVKSTLGVTDLGSETKVYEVRSVAISARQYCVSFRLPKEAALSMPESCEPDAKRPRLGT